MLRLAFTVCSRAQGRATPVCSPLALLLAVAAACGHRSDTSPSHSEVPSGQVAPAERVAPPSGAAEANGTARDGGSAPDAARGALPVQLRVESTPAGLGLSVVNAGATALSLSADVSLESEAGAVESARALTLQATCASQGCITLGVGGELVAPRWLGLPEAERCGALLVPKAPGRYRLRVQDCEGKAQSSVSFTWPTP